MLYLLGLLAILSCKVSIFLIALVSYDELDTFLFLAVMQTVGESRDSNRKKRDGKIKRGEIIIDRDEWSYLVSKNVTV